MSRLSPKSGLLNDPATLADRYVTLPSGAVQLTVEDHANRVLKFQGGGVGNSVTLPEAIGSGDEYEFVVGAALSSGTIVINAKSDSGSNVFVGSIVSIDTSNGTVAVYSSTTNDIITLNGSTQGAAVAGDHLVLKDVAADTWLIVEGKFFNDGSTATPFSG